MSDYIIRASRATIPSSWRGAYLDISVLEVEDGKLPKHIGSKCVKSVLFGFEQYKHVGATARCEAVIALKSAIEFYRTVVPSGNILISTSSSAALHVAELVSAELGTTVVTSPNLIVLEEAA